MKLEDIRIGSLIEIIISRNGSSYKTVSKIEYVDEKFIGVSPIASVHGLFRFADDDEIDLIYRDEDKYWKWEGVKAGTARRRDGSRLHIFAAFGKAVPVNRRTQFRFEIGTEIKMNYEMLKSEIARPEDKEQKTQDVRSEENDINDMTPTLELDRLFMKIDEQYEQIECRGYLKDLSEGGASVESDTRLDRGMFINFTIDSEIGTVYLRGVIIRVIEDEHGYFDYTYGVSFVETSKNYMQYFYLQQRKQLYENKE